LRGLIQGMVVPIGIEPNSSRPAFPEVSISALLGRHWKGGLCTASDGRKIPVTNCAAASAYKPRQPWMVLLRKISGEGWDWYDDRAA
jgi:hypothetical protein